MVAAEGPEFGDQVLRRLDVLIALLLDARGESEGLNMTEKINRLSKLGLDRNDIGQIIGKSRSYVSAVLSRKPKPTSEKPGDHD